MNFAKINEDTREKIIHREKSIAFFVASGNYRWVVDWNAHFSLDERKNTKALYEKNELAKYLPIGSSWEQWIVEQEKKFRYGIPVLDKKFLYEYFNYVCNLEVVDLRDEFFRDDAGCYSELAAAMERDLNFGEPTPNQLIPLRAKLYSKLPKFYINYDRKIFMHMMPGRHYESVVLDGWWGAQADFEHMIPAAERYWQRSLGEDFWAVTNFRDYS